MTPSYFYISKCSQAAVFSLSGKGIVQHTTRSENFLNEDIRAVAGLSQSQEARTKAVEGVGASLCGPDLKQEVVSLEARVWR